MSTQTLYMSEETAMKCQRVSLSYTCTDWAVSTDDCVIHTYTCTNTIAQANTLIYNDSILFHSLAVSLIRVYRELYAELQTGAQHHTNTQTHDTLNHNKQWATVCAFVWERKESEKKWADENGRVTQSNDIILDFQHFSSL